MPEKIVQHKSSLRAKVLAKKCSTQKFLIGPSSRFEGRMKRPFVAKSGSTSKRLTTMRSENESLSFWKVDLAVKRR